MSAQDNIGRLRRSGLLPNDAALPTAYQEIVANLSPDELDTLLAIKARLDGAADDPEVRRFTGEVGRANFIAF